MVKKKTCKFCKTKFYPNTTLQTLCSPKCYFSYTKAKKKEKHQKLREEATDWHKKAWKEISRFVRYSAPRNSEGKVKCYTCSKELLPSEADAGHFKHNKLDDDLRNLKIQCSKCNRYLSGNLSEYRKNLVRDYGEEWVARLEQDAKECKPKKQWQWKEVYLKFKEMNK